MRPITLFVVVLLVAGCGSSEPATTTTNPPTTATTTAVATTTADEAGPTPLPAGFVEPGEYITERFRPPVLYRIQQKHILRAFQTELVTGFESGPNGSLGGDAAVPYRGIAVHNVWLSLSSDEVLDKLTGIQHVDVGVETQANVGGFTGGRYQVDVQGRTPLWTRGIGDTGVDTWFLQRGPLDIILLDTPAGTLAITVMATAEEWDDFLPVAEEILAGISFPDPSTPTAAETEAQPLPADGFLEPGEYFTTVFQPQVLYRLERKHILRPFQEELATGLQSHRAFPGGANSPIGVLPSTTTGLASPPKRPRRNSGNSTRSSSVRPLPSSLSASKE